MIENRKNYLAPCLRVKLVRTEPFCASTNGSNVPDYDPITGFEWGDE